MRFGVNAPSRGCGTLTIVALLAWGASAQQPPLTLSAIKFSGLERYSEQQSEFASHLKVGSPVTIAQIQSASDRLAQSGAFDKISYSYTTHGNEISIEFQVAETKNRLSATFDNFVWFTTDELDRTLRARVPFYDGTVPERGTTSQEVSDALHALLQSNGIAGTVSGLPSGPFGRYVSLDFRVSGVAMPVHSIQIPGAAGVSESELVGAAKELIGKDYSAADTQAVASLTLLAIYRRHGYLQAHFDHPQANVIGNTRTGAAFDIAVTVPVNEGLQYSWDHAAWTGNQKFSADELNAFLAMKAHEVASQDKIDAGLNAVAIAYSKQGFIDTAIAPKVLLDDSTRLVTYDSAINEGIQYKMGQLQITGLDDRLAADLIKKWQIKPGQLFDGTYSREFLKKTAFPRILESGKRPGGIDENLQRNKDNATVDLVLAFR